MKRFLKAVIRALIIMIIAIGLTVIIVILGHYSPVAMLIAAILGLLGLLTWALYDVYDD